MNHITSKPNMTILSVETSCDETAAAVVTREKNAPLVTVKRSIVASQIDLHQKYGGVYPEIASREHIRQILPVLSEALELPITHENRLPDLRLHGIDALAVTHGPGLIGSLLIGTQTMAALSYATNLPLLPVNHLAGHIYASFIAHHQDQPIPEFPLIALIVSGGHTMLIYMKDHQQYQLLGQTRDDAAGEAFDKIAKLLDLPYPGGPHISKLAQSGDRLAYTFPIGLEKENTFDFSFSGLKTAVLRHIQSSKQPLSQTEKANIAASFERSVTEALLLKTSRAFDDNPVKHLIVGGGVAANSYLRHRLASLFAHKPSHVTLHIPPLSLCTDNAAVIGAAACYGTIKPIKPSALTAYARLPLHSI